MFENSICRKECLDVQRRQHVLCTTHHVLRPRGLLTKNPSRYFAIYTSKILNHKYKCFTVRAHQRHIHSNWKQEPLYLNKCPSWKKYTNTFSMFYVIVPNVVVDIFAGIRGVNQGFPVGIFIKQRTIFFWWRWADVCTYDSTYLGF